ncbi:hypothetical protein PTTG_25815 [Puccinia triticina 1-1 BBBD Race 1]|uniref:Uncharacterized protein n=1 Tax=Puccinia triticina (isolate 1-1 / race 1 (BBBD)) TaxID=630390 RepID=A0A180H022_PUCT1|nr:hypothetical protein PTTG_25815 [Puccinia triticina 1-1 BBBD Race 1]WAR59008.1 hypothetical protein PtB15_10B350 [Puccinia triticina]
MDWIYCQRFLPFVCLLAISLSIQQDEPLKVKINTKDDFCLVVPKAPYTKIVDSEKPGGQAVWCQSPSAKTSPSAGIFNSPFWSDVEISRPKAGVIQMTGCIDVNSSNRLKPNDDGGRYYSDGRSGGQGNPANSFCDPYRAYVELIEPLAKRACIRCCQNSAMSIPTSNPESSSSKATQKPRGFLFDESNYKTKDLTGLDRLGQENYDFE